MKSAYSLRIRLLTPLMQMMTKRQLGYKPDFILYAEMMSRYSFKEIGTWTKEIESVVNELKQRFGDFKAQILISTAAYWNGCAMCAPGHMYAANLYYFRDHGELFPIGENEIYELRNMADVVYLARLRDVLNQNHDDLLRLIERQYELRTQPSNRLERVDNDDVLLALQGAWGWISECTSYVKPSEPLILDVIGKDTQLVKAYRAQRALSRR